MFKIKQFLFITAILLIGSCNGVSLKKKNFPDTPYYNLNSPKIIELNFELDEISGIAYYPKDTSVFAISDETGTLFKVPLNSPTKTKSWEFYKKKDFEDLVLIDSTFYVLISNGDIVSIDFKNDSVLTNKFDFPEGSKKDNEFESLIVLKDSALAIICKECKDDKKDKLSRYKLNFRDSLPQYVSIEPLSLKEAGKNYKGKLKPSAAAFHPITGELYVISAIQNILCIFSADGKFVNSYELNPTLFKQPEGIAFTPEGHMIISNEYAGEGSANLLLFKNKQF